MHMNSGRCCGLRAQGAVGARAGASAAGASRAPAPLRRERVLRAKGAWAARGRGHMRGGLAALVVVGAAKTFVPGADGESAEIKGARSMQRLFTWAAIRIVQAQLEGAGNDGGFAPQMVGWDGKVESPMYNDLRKAMEEIPLGDGDEWLLAMMSVNPPLARRIMETRKHFVTEFDWRECQELTEQNIEANNMELMRRHIKLSSEAVLDTPTE